MGYVVLGCIVFLLFWMDYSEFREDAKKLDAKNLAEFKKKKELDKLL